MVVVVAAYTDHTQYPGLGSTPTWYSAHIPMSKDPGPSTRSPHLQGRGFNWWIRSAALFLFLSPSTSLALCQERAPGLAQIHSQHSLSLACPPSVWWTEPLWSLSHVVT